MTTDQRHINQVTRNATRPPDYEPQALWRIFWQDKRDVQKACLGGAIVLFGIVVAYVAAFGWGF